jgi:hypothetical protein
VLPFEEGDDDDPSIVMSIIPELACFFETKKRAPIRVVFETVKLRELKAKRRNDNANKAITNELCKE